MTTPSNLYAEKVYSEHPIALWPLDENIDYISLISEEQRDMSNWSLTDVFSHSEGDLSYIPFSTSFLNEVQGNNNSLMVLRSENLYSLNELHSDLRTFCLGSYYYANTDYYEYIEIGYEYTDPFTNLVIEKTQKFVSNVSNNWIFISGTFEIPEIDAPFRIVIKVKSTSLGSGPSDHIFYFNGISAGQWNEEFNATSLGTSPVNLPTEIGTYETNLKCIEANSYGTNLNKGYYLISNNILSCKNTSIPMVYGSSGVIKLTPNDKMQVVDAEYYNSLYTSTIDGGTPTSSPSSSYDGGIVVLTPSFIIPGLGLLNHSGRYKDYTLEFWANIDSNTTNPQRIVGPIASSDGIYVENGNITLVIGKTFGSHFIGSWQRPMLIDLIVTTDSAKLLINGEVVISLTYSSKDLSLPTQLRQDGKEQDYIGFYTYQDIPSISIDAVAIYSYQVPEIIAKRRFVYGQGVGSSELINSSFAGTEAYIDYSFAEYTADYNYPDFASWNQGVFDNLETDKVSLKIPQYELPTIYTATKSIEDLYFDSFYSQTEDIKYFTFRPNSSWNNVGTYLNFPRLDVLNNSLKMIYAVISSDNISSNDEVLIKIYNNLNTDYLSIIKNGSNIKYLFNFNNEEVELYSFTYIVGNKVVIGFNIDTLSASFNNVGSFFNNLSNLKMYALGDESGTKSFEGKLYTLGFGTGYSATFFEGFNTDGIIVYDEYLNFLDKLTSYTLLPTIKYDTFFLDIGISGYWEDYLPLSYFAKYITNDIGNKYYDLDFLQFNLDYPVPTQVTLEETTSEWTYLEMDNSFDYPVQKTYQEFDNQNITQWINYEDMSQNADKYKKYNVSNNDVKAYITMQYLVNGANLLQNNFTTTVKIDENKVIDFTKHPSWETHRFEVIDGSIIYPPKFVDFNDLAIVYRVEFNVKNTVNRPLNIKKLQLTSQALSHNESTPIGTKFGSSLYPYTKTGFYYNFKRKNPFAISKNSTPYLYTTDSSGIEIRNEYETDIDKGLSFVVNQGKSAEYNVAAIQFWVRSNKSNFPATRQKMFEINYLGNSIDFFIQANSEYGDRGKIIAVDRLTQQSFTDLKYYVNGNIVREPVISIKEWSAIGISFSKNLNFNNTFGSINITGPYLFNNIAYYQATNLQLAQSRTLRPWSKVKLDELGAHDWEDWESYLWNQVLVLSTSDLYGTDPSQIYKRYIGTNKIVVDDNSGIEFSTNKIKIYRDPTWEAFVVVPV